MNLNQLIYFTAVVEEGSISAAARKLNISQPPLSLHIRHLEEECGLPLFVRGARSMKPTEAGRLLYDYARRIMELRDSAEDDLASLAQGRSGSIRLGIISSGDCREFFNKMTAFRTQFPSVSFRVMAGNTYELLNALEKHTIELAVIRTPYSEDHLTNIPLRTDHIMAVGTVDQMSALPGRSDAPIRLLSLRHTPVILYRRWENIIRRLAANEGTSLNIYCINDDAHTSLEWAAYGLGVALVPASILTYMPELPCRALEEEELVSTISLVYRDDTQLSTNASRFVEAMQQE